MMKNKYSILLALLALIVVCSSCKEEDPLLKEAREFALKQGEVGVYEKDKTKPIFVYDEDKHQLAANPMQFMCRIQTDDQAKMLQMTLDKQPTLAATCKLSVKSKGVPSIGSQCQVEVLKIDGDKVWLLDHESYMSFIFYYPQQ